MILLQDEEGIKTELDRKTRHSTRFAVIVMHPEDKAAAQEHASARRWSSRSRRPRGWSMKISLLYNFTSDEEQRFREITRGVAHD